MPKRKRRFKFNRNGKIRFVIYARMSSDEQNPRSPEQQITTIRETIRRLGLDWSQVEIYIDSGITGKKTKRPQLMKLLDDIISGKLQVDAVVLDVPDRLGRNDDVPKIRQLLHENGVVIVDAKSEFRDPTTADGKLLAFVGDMHGKEENERKSHNVRRGKRDAVSQRRWPGGPPPTGFQLEACGTEIRGAKQVILKKLVPNLLNRILVDKSFEVADATGWGAPRVARALNRDPSVPEELKPVHPNTVARFFENKLYKGVYEWGRSSADYEDDVRVVEPNPEDEWLVVEDYCEPLIPTEVFDRVHTQHLARCRPSEEADEQGEPCSHAGIALKYPLAGLVRCQCCGRAMVATKRKQDKDAIYRCPYVYSEGCSNRVAVPETWLRSEVMRLLVARLLLPNEPCPDSISREMLLNSATFPEFLALVQAMLRDFESAQPTTTQALLAEREDLQKKQNGVINSMRDPDLHSELRTRLNEDYAGFSRRISEIDGILSRQGTVRSICEAACDPQKVAEKLRNIANVLMGQNVALANLEFARVLDRITVGDAGTVVVRMSKFAFLLPDELPRITAAAVDTDGTAIRSQRLPGRALPVDVESELRGELGPDNSFDRSRFSRFGPEWFWVDELTIPVKQTWAEEHAIEIAEWRISQQCTIDDLCERYHGVARKTIYNALKHAKSLGVDATRIDGRTFKGNWARENAQAVVDFLKANGNSVKLAEKHFEKSAPTIRKAVRFASEPEDANSTTDENGESSPDRAAA